MNILVIQLRQLGDILLTTPVIRALIDSAPGVSVDVLTYPMGKLIIPGNPMVRRHLIAPQNGVLDSLRFVRQLQKYRYDVVIDFMSTPRSAVLARLVKANRRISFDTGRKHFFTDIVPRDGEPDYIVREKFRLLAPLGIKGSDVRLMLPWSEGDAGAREFFLSGSERLSASNRRVMLSPTHRRLDRKWSSQSWADLARWLEQTQNATVVWAWGPGEEEEVKTIRSLASDAGFLAPKTSFRELAALTAACDFFIGNSNGPSHVAVAVNTPSLQLHGPTHAGSWSPLTSRHRGIQRDSMQSITIESVKSEIEAMWPVVDQGSSQLRSRGPISCSEDVWLIRPTL